MDRESLVVVALVVAAVIGAAILFALVIGIKAFRCSLDAGSDTLALRLLALNLCEPPVNMVLVGFMFLRTINDLDHPQVTITSLVVVTMPMVVLLTPVFGLFWPSARSVSVGLLLSSLTRWVLTLFIFVSIFTDGGLTKVELLLLLLSASALIVTAAWGKRQIEAISGVAPRPHEAPARSSF